MSHELSDKRLAFLVAQIGVEHAELTDPWMAVQRAGGKPVLVSTAPGSIQAVHRGVPTSVAFRVDKLIEEFVSGDCAALVLPGGSENAAILRGIPAAVNLVGDFVGAGKPVAAISHGSGILVSAGVLTGKLLTGWPGLETEIVQAGARWADEEVQFCPDHGWMLVTAKSSRGLPEFTRAMLTAFI